MNDSRTDRWQLPDGVDELLPEAAWRVESLRRAFVDCCRSWGFELVMPPLIEYIDSLLSGTGETMNLQTFKLVDQHNGRTLGVRADMTPQVARIDAHALASELPNRLFYTGTVLRTRADGAGGSRSPQQFGAELFGHAGVESDMEVCRLMLETVKLGGMPAERLLLDLGHVGVYRALAAEAALAPDDESAVFEALQRGSVPDFIERLADVRRRVDDVEPASESDGSDPGRKIAALDRLASLCTLRGDASLIGRAREVLDGACAEVGEALDTLERLVEAMAETHPDVPVHVDLAELRGYRYHTGPLFAVHDEGGAQLARGGRYDRIGEVFGRARPATGFSGDLKQLADARADVSAASPRDAGPALASRGAIHVPEPAASGAWTAVQSLRANGERVLAALPGTPSERVVCDRELVRTDGRWTVLPIDCR